jgi:hypothetical protein
MAENAHHQQHAHELFLTPEMNCGLRNSVGGLRVDAILGRGLSHAATL